MNSQNQFGQSENDGNVEVSNGVTTISIYLSHKISGDLAGGGGGWDKNGNTSNKFFIDSKGIVKQNKWTEKTSNKNHI